MHIITQAKIHAGVLFFLICVVGITLSYPHNDEFPAPDNLSITYTRFPEIQQHCGFLISSASELQPDENRGERMKKELLFMNGDWEQERGGAPLMPFDSRELPSNTFGNGPPLKLVSFWLMDVDPVRRAKNTVSIRGVMEIAIVRTDSLSYKPYLWSSNFYMQQGITKMTILFEGVYVESEENGGQRSICLLGNATFGTSAQEMDSCAPGDPWNPCLLQVKNQPFSTSKDDQIMLVLQYPKTFSLTARGITGEMKSLNDRGNVTYFDKVHISSQLRPNSVYHFGSEELVSKACSPFPYQDTFVNDKIEMFKGDEYCETLRKHIWNEAFEFVSTGTSIEQNRLGPFLLDRELEAAARDNLNQLRLMIQELVCVPETDQNGIRKAKVSAVFRVIHKSGNIYREEMRTGLSSRTLTAEGIWRSSHGQLCMVGCLGNPYGLPEACASRIILYIPLTISIKQHSSVLGTITSLNGSDSHPPLVFRRIATLKEIMNRHQWEDSQLKRSYNYSTIIQAREFQKRSMPSKFERIMRKSFFRYPSSRGDDIASFSFLADVLSVKVCAATPQTSTDGEKAKTYAEIVILSIGSLFGRHRSDSYQENLGDDQKPFHSASQEIEVSGHLSITGSRTNISLFFEGLFDPTVGEMYLIGCQDVQEIKHVKNNSRNLDGGIDCLTDIKVQYSPKNARWLLNPNIKVSINSRRRKEDHLYFHPISINTFVLSYQKKIQDMIIRKGVEDVLRIVLLICSILCIQGQTCCAESRDHPTAYISLVMLGLQTLLGFSIPLITNGEALLKRKAFFASCKYDIYQLEKLFVFKALNCCIKILLLFALLEAVELVQKIWDSRKKMKIPSDKFVFIFTVLIHVTGIFILEGLCEMYRFPSLFQSQNNGLAGTEMERLESYGCLVQDLFLLPQMIGNWLWGVQGKPLRKLYYIGFTSIRLVLLAYDCVRDPIPNPINQSEEIELQYLGFAFYDKLGNMIVSVLVVLLAVTVYIQQTYRHIKKVEEEEEEEECESLDFKYESYQRLLSE